MFRVNSIFIDSLSAENRQYLLNLIIPFLTNFSSKQGTEGKVFFIGKDIVVKEYFSKIDCKEILEGGFKKYCEECEEFYKKGYKIPKIFDWTIMSNPDHSGFKYYLLEERIPGRELFFDDMLSFYEDNYKNYIEKIDYNFTLNNPEFNVSLFKDVFEKYPCETSCPMH